MKVGEPSRTALATAFSRAYHQIAPEPRILVDPVAVRITGASPKELIDRATAILNEVGMDPMLQRRRRMFLAARSRFAEETIATAVAEGIQQVVILGAGLDTFAYRNPYDGVRVFEVDHPDTQAWKRERLAAAGIDIPDSLTFAPVDFESRTLDEGLSTAGFDRGQPAVFVWLGVVMYLTKDAIVTILEFIAGQSASTRVVIDYLYPPTSDTSQQARVDRVAAIGEPWLSFFTAEEFADQLRALGFDQIEDHTGAVLVDRYLERPAPSTGGEAGPHVVRAVSLGSKREGHYGPAS
ncbi:class I SAM-dependent methyltransferase [Nocardia sp. NPDC023852]|uniref:class I SAM-dependent methyltransferase n=1 Tax=Nocardia sp. NPDC023852 TaxID=3154697 RepID=UPI0033D8E8F8